MQRESCAVREGWTARLEAQGFDYHSIDGAPYWTEGVCYRFTEAEVDQLEAATLELHRMCLDLVDDVVARGDYRAFALDDAAATLIERSWTRREPALLGRMDLHFDGTSPPRLYEYNADTPTSLLETAAVQWFWLMDVHPKADQFNSIHEKLIEAWRRRWPGTPRTVWFASFTESREDAGNNEYLRDTCAQAGHRTVALDILDIGWKDACFIDLDNAPIERLFKLYPWEWLLDEAFGRHIPNARTEWIEPAWKMLLSTKALLPALWARHPQHPNLLPAVRNGGALAGPVVAKPRLGREGAGIERFASAAAAFAHRPFADVVLQSYRPLPSFEGHRPVIGSWVIGNEAAGIGIRESLTEITSNTSRFVPHYF